MNWRRAVFVLSFALVSCSAPSEKTLEAAGPGLEGVWRTEGYGNLLEVTGEAARLWEYTDLHCVVSDELGIVESDHTDAEAALAMGANLIDVLPGSSADERWLRPEGTASQRRLMRASGLLEHCGAEVPEGPQSVLDVFWQTFAEHYPFFEMKGIDWEAAGAAARASLIDETTPEELFEVLKGMIEPLEDSHTYLFSPELDRGFGGRRPDPHPLDDETRARAFEIVDETYLTEPPQRRCNDQIVVGALDGDLRYLRLRSFSNYGDSYRAGLACLEESLDVLLAPPSPAGLIIDVRINGGGADPYGLAIASRLATAEYLAYTKEARIDVEDPSRWSEGQPSTVRPTELAGFTGPVVLLTGRDSVSAAETFTMALMGRRPRVTRIGENTQGVFSDVMSRKLPNGWSFGLPNERFLTEDGLSFDGPGIAPHIEAPVFTPAELSGGFDTALERAIEELTLTR